MSNKILFQCDYNEGGHPRILERLSETNFEQTPGYGEDVYCQAAAEKIRDLCGDSNLAVHFLVGGTQTNLTVIAAALRPHQGVVSADTGHINTHETGSIEACGHKVLALPGKEGKITAAQVEEICRKHRESPCFEHEVQPGMVYLSSPSELGTIYSKRELEEMAEVCREYDLYLFVDGARLGYGLMSPDNDLTLSDIAQLCDAFYIGGTKQGALFGEAVVIRNERLKKDFRYMIKQKGGMLAKGRLLGVQFDELFREDLYWELSRHALRLAEKVRDAFEQMGCPFYVYNRTNQVFVTLPDTVLEKLGEKFGFSYECRVDDHHSAVRFCTSWATKEENVDALIQRVRELI